MLSLSIIEEEDGRIAVRSPYHPNFPARARSLGGIWNAARRIWVFDSADHDRVSALCREIYGADGQGNFIAAREQHFGQAEPGTNQSTLADANADMANRSDKNACTRCLGHGVDVGVDLVYWLQRAFVVDRPVRTRSGQALQASDY